jgi:hypothetical protein
VDSRYKRFLEYAVTSAYEAMPEEGRVPLKEAT